MIDRLAKIPNVVGLKWATPRTDAMEFEDVTSHFSKRFTIIDNNLFFPIRRCRRWACGLSRSTCATTGRNGASSSSTRSSAQNYAEIARMMVEEAMPFYKLWVDIEKDYTSGDGYLDKLCMELDRPAVEPLPAADARHSRELSRQDARHDAWPRVCSATMRVSNNRHRPIREHN